MKKYGFEKAWAETRCVKCKQAQKEMMPDKREPARMLKMGKGRMCVGYPTVYVPTGLCYFCRKKAEGLL